MWSINEDEKKNQPGLIHTVTGEIDPNTLGYCQCHEHLYIAQGKSGRLNPALIIDQPEKTEGELLRYYEKGGRAVVDAQPVGCGRMAKELYEASVKTGVHIIASTGFHKLDFYEEQHFVYQLDEDQLAQLFVDEIRVGMYTDKVNGNEVPRVVGLARAGMIKTASDGRDIRQKEDHLPVYKKLFLAAGKASKLTGAPIMTHLEMGLGADSQLEVLTSQGVPTNRIIMSHLDRRIGLEQRDYQLRILKSGVYIQLDTIGRFKYHDDRAEAEFIALLCEKGFENQILLGLDTTKERMKSYGGELGLDYILEQFKYQLQKVGIDDQRFNKFTVINPKHAICFQKIDDCETA